MIRLGGKTGLARKGRYFFMKLILAIVSNDDSGAVSSAITREGFSVTKLATTGGFLMAGNTTFKIGRASCRERVCLYV